jgi:hypothetical protein
MMPWTTYELIQPLIRDRTDIKTRLSAGVIAQIA